MKKLIFGVIAVTSFGFAAIPALAGEGHSGNIQESDMTSVITGNDSATFQRSNQTTRTVRDHAPGDTVNVQRSRQVCDVLGNRSYCDQDSEQSTEEMRRGRNR